MQDSSTIKLDDYRDLFRDSESFSKFINAFRKASSGDLTMLMASNEVVGSVMSPQATKDVIYDRMIQRMASKPGLLEEIADRIDNDEIVD